MHPQGESGSSTGVGSVHGKHEKAAFETKHAHASQLNVDSGIVVPRPIPNPLQMSVLDIHLNWKRGQAQSYVFTDELDLQVQ